MEYEFSAEKLQELLKCFFMATNRGVAIFSEDYKKIAGYPGDSSPFCKYVRTNPEVEQLCLDSNVTAFETCKRTKLPYTYTCHVGLIETTVPILHDESVLGYLMFGQYICGTLNDEWPKIQEKCLRYGFDVNTLKTAITKTSVEAQERILACTKLLETCAAYLFLAKIATLSKSDISERLEKYVSNNLSGDLSISCICGSLRVGKSTLNLIAKRYFGRSIHEYIIEKRIDLAKKLLAETGRPVQEVAALAGISSNNYFSNLFRKHVGVTPKEYRKTHR